jgi:hypothetical protein
MSSLLEAPATTGEIAVGTRKERRIVETREIRIRGTHRRRQVLTRGGVLAGFVLAMVVYPVFGTITPYADAAESLPGVVKGHSPTTAMALLGGGPGLLSSDLPLPEIDGNAQAMVASNSDLISSSLPHCDSTAKMKGTNGRLSSSSLCPLWQGGEQLQSEAATAFTAMNVVYRSVFGHNICLDDSYRSLARQYGTRATRGYLAATPGTSMHGWGLAVDICKESLNGASGRWIRANAATYGWANPAWAKTSKYEPWHWEYVSLTSKYYDSTWTGNYSDGGSSGSSSSSSSSKKSTTTSTETTETTTTDTTDETAKDETQTETGGGAGAKEPTPAPAAPAKP